MSTITKSSKGSNKAPPAPRPSASILLISPANQILLLHRVQTSSSFPSAHVFPGGNLSTRQDGEIPGVEDPRRHEDSEVYRLGAIRECFEESGILLATRNDERGRLLSISPDESDRGRHAVHDDVVEFQEWVKERGGVPDVAGLIPFTRWVTPTNIPKRFTTQMYLYFLPISHSSPSSGSGPLPIEGETVIPTPTSDGGKEHTTARFLPLSKWLSMARSGEIILFPPQFFLMHLLAPYLSPEKTALSSDPSELQRQRDQVMEFLKSSCPSWAEKCISPSVVLKLKDGRVALGLDKPGPELEGSGRRGEDERVVLVEFRKDGPRRVDVAWKKDIFRDERMAGQEGERL